MSEAYDFVVVGAGFAGSVTARRLAEQGARILLIDRRPHVGGNAYDRLDDNGVLIHPYGPHIFHTNSDRIFEFLSRFTEWRPYEHRVLAKVGDRLLPIPINRTTLNQLYGLNLETPEDVEGYLDSVRFTRSPVKTSEDVVLNRVGADLCVKFFAGYTFKQWGLRLDQLSPGVAARIPTRSDDDDRYFTDKYQAIPLHGYTALFSSMLAHDNITIRLGVDFFDIRSDIAARRLIYTGPIDSFYGYRFGKLPYRSLSFTHVHHPHVGQYQPVGTVNFPNDHDYTRITEFKHITGQQHEGTSIVYEVSSAEGDPYYPIPRPENEVVYQQYRQLADAEKDIFFVGRLAEYRYYNMDQVTGAALTLVERLTKAQVDSLQS